MKRRRLESGLPTAIGIVIVGMLMSWSINGRAVCERSGCENEHAPGSSYCYFHDVSSYSAEYEEVSKWVEADSKMDWRQ